MILILKTLIWIGESIMKYHLTPSSLALLHPHSPKQIIINPNNTNITSHTCKLQTSTIVFSYLKIDKRHSYDLNDNKTKKETFEEKKSEPIRDWQLT